MELFNIYTVKDELVNKFMQPTFIQDENEALRLFTYQINSIDLWKANSSDYSLYKIGTYDQTTGTVIGITPEKIIGGRSVVKNAENEKA